MDAPPDNHPEQQKRARERSAPARLEPRTPHLGPAEIDLLADALDEERAVAISYRSQSGAYSTRIVAPVELHHRWITAWCHLRDGEREFTVERIQEVHPPA